MTSLLPWSDVAEFYEEIGQIEPVFTEDGMVGATSRTPDYGEGIVTVPADKRDHPPHPATHPPQRRRHHNQGGDGEIIEEGDDEELVNGEEQEGEESSMDNEEGGAYLVDRRTRALQQTYGLTGDALRHSYIEYNDRIVKIPPPAYHWHFADAFEHAADTGRRDKVSLGKEEMREHIVGERRALKDVLARIRRQRDRARLEEAKQCWTELTKDAAKIHKTFASQVSSRQSNAKRFAQQVQREVQKRVRRTVRAQKEAAGRGRKLSREMASYWKRYNRERQELQKRIEKEEAERLRREEEQREAQRQQRKLNFLLHQTELYSHFMSRKLGMEEDKEEAKAAGRPLEEGKRGDEKEKEDEEEQGFSRADAVKQAEETIRNQRRRLQAFDQETGKQGTLDVDQFQLEKELKDGGKEDEEEELGEVEEPSWFTGTLKPYQRKGLQWLTSLYHQGINGILADEMGLGKTVQTIAFLTHLVQRHNVWGPFLIVSPTSTLHNWEQEIRKFCPHLKVIAYWGTAKERRAKRKGWKNLHRQDAPFHVLITSYRLAVDDEKHLQRVRWEYLILDEAHAIKNSSSARWRTLLSYRCRNRLLLTGTPIQNSMAELWALLHFIMPDFFDSHDEFAQWFSKDIESHASGGQQAISEHQVSRLHAILKPFMLRRVKKDVESEMAPKIEIDVPCGLSRKQRKMYRAVKTLTLSTLLDSMRPDESLMNLMMQFRKVCNHPDLFEKTDVTSPFQFQQPIPIQPPLPPQNAGLAIPSVSFVNNNPIHMTIPRLIYRSLFPHSLPVLSRHTLLRRFSPFAPDRIHHDIHHRDHPQCFSFLRFTDTSVSDAAAIATASITERFQRHLAARRRAAWWSYIRVSDGAVGVRAPHRSMFLVHDVESYTGCGPVEMMGHGTVRHSLVFQGGDPAALLLRAQTRRVRRVWSEDVKAYPVVAPPIDVHVSERNFENLQHWVLFGNKEKDELSQLMNVFFTMFGSSRIALPSMSSIVASSGKLKTLDRLLMKLRDEGHRVLIFCQMTKMLDILEDFMWSRKYKFFRLDGSTESGERRDMVTDFQEREDIFAFLLSTRAGGLGINLTAADTVIFYDSDWNPTSDAQAMDRTHRIGQTKQVTVYRMLTKNTIEERILKRAQMKNKIQSTVYGGKFKEADQEPTEEEVMSMLLDDMEMDQSMLPTQHKRASKRSRPNDLIVDPSLEPETKKKKTE